LVRVGPVPPLRWTGSSLQAAVLAAALAAFAALAFAFAWQPDISSIGDDSVTYLTLARFFSGDEAPWAPYFTWFPPLFPLLIAAVGGAHDFARAHLLVAACAVLSLPLVYRHALLILRRRDAALAIAILFELTATAWVSIKPILSEPTFLLFSMASVVFFESRMAAAPRNRDRWLFGLLMAAAVLTRVAGVFLLAAFAAHVAMETVRRRRRPAAADLIPLVPAVGLTLAWWAVRPLAGGDIYGWASEGFVQSWFAHGPEVVVPAARAFYDGWVASFVADADVSRITSAVLAIPAILAVAGTWMRVRANALGGWYAAIMLAAVFLLFFGEDAARRYLYPILPLLLVNAALALAALARRLPGRAGAAAIALGVAAPALACLPASVLLVQKSLDRRPVLQDFPIRYSDISEYYTTVNVARARALAAKHAAVIAGFEAIASVTPPDAKVMWERPEYISLLSHREADAWYYGWDDRTLARRIQASGVTHVVVSGLFKADFAHDRRDPARIHRALERFAEPVLEIRNPVVPAKEFVLMKIDPDRLAAFIAAAGAGEPPREGRS
jgi:hypothetical protein